MSYKAGIIQAITELKDRTGSSSIAIKKHMQANLPADKKWINGMFLKALKDGVAAGDLVQVEDSFKLSADFKKKVKKASKPNLGLKRRPPAKKPKKAVSVPYTYFILYFTFQNCVSFISCNYNNCGVPFVPRLYRHPRRRRHLRKRRAPW